MNQKLKQLRKMQVYARRLVGVCVACISTEGQCVKPMWEGQDLCGRDQKDLPDLLKLLSRDEEMSVKEYLTERQQAAEELMEQIARYVEAFRREKLEKIDHANLDEQTKEFIRTNFV